MTLALCFEEEANAEIDGCLRRVLAGHAVAPTLWALETANVVNLAARCGRIQRADRRPFLDLFQMLPIHLIATNQANALGRVADLADQHALTAYDAAYLAAAVSFGLPLATCDKALSRAPEAAGVSLMLCIDELRSTRHCRAGNCAQSRSRVIHSHAANQAPGTKLPVAFVRMQRSATIAQCPSPVSTATLLGASSRRAQKLSAVDG